MKNTRRSQNVPSPTFFDKIGQPTLNGIFGSMRMNITRLAFTADPWCIFQSLGFTNVLDRMAQREVTLFPDSKSNLLRETMLPEPFIGPASQRAVVERNLTTTTATGIQQTDLIRERDRYNVALTPLIFIPSVFFAFDENARSEITVRLLANGYCPQYLSELFKKVRCCSSPTLRFTLGIYRATWTILSGRMPSLIGTFYDPDFLSSSVGQQAYVSWLTNLRLAPGNYIPFIDATQQSLPAPESNFMITFNAITVGRNPDFAQIDVLVYTGNTMSEYLNVHGIDSWTMATHYVDTQDNQFVMPAPAAYRVEYNTNSLSIVDFIVLRVTGLQNNPGRPKTNDSQSSSATTTQQSSRVVDSRDVAATATKRVSQNRDTRWIYNTIHKALREYGLAPRKSTKFVEKRNN